MAIRYSHQTELESALTTAVFAQQVVGRLNGLGFFFGTVDIGNRGTARMQFIRMKFTHTTAVGNFQIGIGNIRFQTENRLGILDR